MSLALGCRDPEPLPVEHSTAPAPPLCGLATDNALRITCAWPSGPGTLRVVGDGFDRTFEGADGAVVAWGLRPSTPYTATLSGGATWSGEVVTDEVPAELAIVFEELVAGPSRLDHLLFPTGCGSNPGQVFVTDPAGTVEWYGGTGLTGGLASFDETAAGVVVLAGRRWVRELRWDGTIGVDAERDLEVFEFPHHAVSVLGDQIAVLDTRVRQWPSGPFLDDGVAFVSGDRLVNGFVMGDVFDPQGRTGFAPDYWSSVFPGVTDATHLNSVELQPGGGFLLSAKHLDTLFSIEADGSIGWTIAGSSFAPDFAQALTPVGAVSFEFPHHVNRAPWGNLLVFDTGREFLVQAQVVELAVDEVARTVTEVRRWSLGAVCPTQSSAYGLPDGSVVATCAAQRTIYELSDDPATEPSVRRAVRVACVEGEPSGGMPRAKPISF